MKQTITKYELAILDKIALVANDHRQAQLALADVFEAVLLVDDGSPDEMQAIEGIVEYLLDGAPEPVEKFVASLGIAIHDPLEG